VRLYNVDLSALLSKIQTLPFEEFVNPLSKDEQKIIYLSIQIFRILISIFFVFSAVYFLYIGLLLNPQSSLFEWSRNHRNLVIIIYIIFVFMPAAAMFGLSSILEPISTSLYKNLLPQVVSPRLVWAIGIGMFFLAQILLGLIWSFSGV
jgi:hypothetical protein